MAKKDNIFVRAKEYCKQHPRCSFQDAIQKVKGHKVSGVKTVRKTVKPKLKAIRGTSKPCVSGARRISGTKAATIKAKPQTAIKLARGIVTKIDRMENEYSKAKGKELKQIIALAINAEHRKLDKLKHQLKKQA